MATLYRKSDIPDNLQKYFCPAEIGLEETPAEYVAKLVEVFREVRRVLRSDGTCWVNLGDSYAGSMRGSFKSDEAWESLQERSKANGYSPGVRARTAYGTPTGGNGLKPKDLCGIPWRVAFALQEDGWWLRQDIIWSKLNPMPESVTDRCTKAHEYIFLLSKSARYFYDAEAVKEEAEVGGHRYVGARDKTRMPFRSDGGKSGSAFAFEKNGHQPRVGDGNSRNRRSVWTVATQPYPGAHFAVFPPKLIEPCILAGTSAEGACERCGAPWVRVVEKSGANMEARYERGEPKRHGVKGVAASKASDVGGFSGTTKTTGWRPSCDCNAGKVPCVVLDPFGGSCTTLEVARKNGCRGIAIELNEDYCRLGVDRLRQGVLI